MMISSKSKEFFSQTSYDSTTICLVPTSKLLSSYLYAYVFVQSSFIASCYIFEQASLLK